MCVGVCARVCVGFLGRDLPNLGARPLFAHFLPGFSWLKNMRAQNLDFFLAQYYSGTSMPWNIDMHLHINAVALLP